jgi:hypothetical protein
MQTVPAAQRASTTLSFAGDGNTADEGQKYCLHRLGTWTPGGRQRRRTDITRLSSSPTGFSVSSSQRPPAGRPRAAVDIHNAGPRQARASV